LRNWIEYGLKQSKNELGWADFRLTDYAQIQKWWEIVMSAYLLVSLHSQNLHNMEGKGINNKRIDAAVNKSVSSLKNWIQQTQTNIHCDETPWVVKGVKEWLWIFANTNFALFHAADTRAGAELETILGLNYSGVLSSDNYSVYNGYDVKAQQKCLAHLHRHFKKLIQLPGLNNQKIGEKFVKLIDEAFKNYSLFQQNQNISELFAWAWGLN
jgi:transposase